MAEYKSRAAQLLNALHSQAFYNKLGLAAIRIIKDRTSKGKDVYGKTFESYSDPYAKLRESKGINTHPVNMRFSDLFGRGTGGMMNKIGHVVANDLNSVAVLIKDPIKEQIAVYHNIQGAGKGKVIRKFWGIERAVEIKQLANIGYKALVDILKKL